MSNVLKLNAKNLKVQLLDDLSRKNFNVPTPEEVMKKKMEQSYFQGLEEGRRSAEAELNERLKIELQNAYKTIENISAKVEDKLNIMERQFGENIFYLALQISEKILRKQIQIDSPVVDNVKLALNKIVGASRITIRINPKEEEKIRTALSDDSALSFNKIKLEADSGMQPGECVVESDIGNVDTRIESQLEEIKKHFETFFEQK